MRRVVTVKVYRILRYDGVRMSSHRLAGVWVDIESREIAARYVHPNPVPCLEDITGRWKGNLDLIDLARLHQFFFLPTLPITGSDNRIDKVHVVAGGIIFVWRIDIN